MQKVAYEKARLRMKDGGFNLTNWRTNNLELEAEVEKRENQKPEISSSILEVNDKTYAKKTFDRKMTTKMIKKRARFQGLLGMLELT